MLLTPDYAPLGCEMMEWCILRSECAKGRRAVARYEFYSQGKLRNLSVQSIEVTRAHLHAAPSIVGRGKAATRGSVAVKRGLRKKGSGAPKAPRASASAVSKEMTEAVAAVHAQNERLGPLFQSTREADMGIVVPKLNEPIVLVTDTVVIDGAKKPEIAWLRDEFGLEVLREGLQGKVLLRAPEGGDQGRKLVFEAARTAFERGHVAAAHPNFVSKCFRG